MQRMMKNFEPDGPDPRWVRDARARLLSEVARHRRRRRGVWAGWLAGGGAVAAVLALMLWIPGAGTGFAQVQRSIEQSHTIQFVSTLTLERQGVAVPLGAARSWADRELGARLDVEAMGAPLAQFWLPRQGGPMLIDHSHAAVVPLQLPASLDPRDLLRLDPATLVRQIGGFAGRIDAIPPGEAPPAGAGLRGFRIPAASMGFGGDSTLDLWVDAHTFLPARIDVRVTLSADDAVLWTLDRFAWNEPIDMEQLMLDIPAGYERIDALVVPEPDEGALLRTLERYAQLNHGRFPTTQLVAWESLAKLIVVAMQPEATWAGLPPPMNHEAGQRAALGDAIAGAVFYLRLYDAGAQPSYFGRAVRLGDDDTLVQWRLPDGATRRITGKLESETTP